MSLIIALQHFEVYLSSLSSSTVVCSYSPLTFIHEMKQESEDSDAAYCNRNIILTPGTSKEKTVLFLMPC